MGCSRHSRHLFAIIGALWLALTSGAAMAVGGPPLVTDDPDTPGDGHWEINVATIMQRTQAGYLVATPDADINYGWGDNIQLKADLPYSDFQPVGASWRSGPGFANYGVKWRFVDEDEAGVSISTYPQYAHSLADRSIQNGIAPAGGQFFLPLEVSGKLGQFELDGEIGRNFVVGHDCAEGVQCLAEVHVTRSEAYLQTAANTQTLLNLGLTWKLNESMSLLAAAGREFGTKTPDQIQSLVYVGIQITR
jgi:hypothetical protein